MKAFFLLLSMMLFWSCDPSTQEKKEMEETDKIRAAREFSNQAIEHKDTAALASIWTIDYHLISSRNREGSGRAANRDSFFKEFSDKPDVIYVRTPGRISVFEQWNMASETGTWVGHWTEKGAQIELNGNYFAKWHKVNGAWLIRAEVFVPLMCKGGDFCDRSPIP